MAQNMADSINKAKEFIALWVKFNQLYKEAMGKSSISPEEETAFLETKSIIARNFQNLTDSFTIDRVTVDHTYDVVNQILSLKSISTLSEPAIKKIEHDWHQSYISLNRLLGHLEAERDKAKQTDNPAPKIYKAILNGIMYIGGVLLLVLVLLFLAYILGILK